MVSQRKNIALLNEKIVLILYSKQHDNKKISRIKSYISVISFNEQVNYSELIYKTINRDVQIENVSIIYLSNFKSSC